MSTNQLKQPFQYEKINLESIRFKRDKDQVANAFGTIKRIWTYLVREKFKLILVLLMVFISSALALLGLYMVGMAIYNFIDLKKVAGLGKLLLALLFVYIGHSLAIFLQNFWMVGIAQNTVYDL